MSSNEPRALISGASIAGLATAYWLRRLGYAVTVVEVTPGLRRGGAAVDIRDGTVEVIERMGLLEQIGANRLSLKRWEFRNADDRTERVMTVRADGDPPSEDHIEIERDVLIDLLFDTVGDDVETIFGDQVTELRDEAGGVQASFARTSSCSFDLVVGCDGAHSNVRRLWFGPESDYAHFLGQYFAISIVDKLLIERDTAQMFNVPRKAVTLNAYKDKTDVIFIFTVDAELAIDYRDQDRQRRIVAEQFADNGWRTPELLGEIADSANFYFDKMSQIRMPSWTRGRVALVGDAAYCASPAAGRGGSLALDGAAALADALRVHGADVDLAFGDYDRRLRPFIDEVQADAKDNLATLIPMTDEAISARNAGPA